MLLYYYPGACSLAVHIALEEAGLPYTLSLVQVMEGEHLREDFKQLHPFSRIPVLQLDDGRRLTEVSALLSYVATLVPERGLLPAGGVELALAQQWLSTFASEVHPPYAMAFRPARLLEEEAAHAAVKAGGRARFWERLQVVDACLQERATVLESGPSLVDAYALVFYLWGVRGKLPVADLKGYTRLAQAASERPAARRALEQEELWEPVYTFFEALKVSAA